MLPKAVGRSSAGGEFEPVSIILNPIALRLELSFQGEKGRFVRRKVRYLRIS